MLPRMPVDVQAPSSSQNVRDMERAPPFCWGYGLPLFPRHLNVWGAVMMGLDAMVLLAKRNFVTRGIGI